LARIATGLWGGLALLAVLWPGHLDGPLDGLPLDGVTEAILLGLTAPILWWLQPSFLQHRLVRALIVALLIAKASSALLARDGWCVQFDTPKPLVAESRGRIHTWDVRADWQSRTPQCSAIITRAYDEYKKFPVWFFNMPPTDRNLPRPEDRPPYATLDMTVIGQLFADEAGELEVQVGPTMATALTIDGAPVDGLRAKLAPGPHAVQITSRMTRDNWRFVPRWNGAPFGTFGFPHATLTGSSATDRAIRDPLSWLIQLGVAALLIAWIATFLLAWGDPITLGFSLAASLVLGWIGLQPSANYGMASWAAWSITALGSAIALTVPKPLQTLKGAFVLVGIPWLAFVTAVHASHIGRFSLYAGGDDMWMFQRFAYRIYLQGYWLQGGEPTFWFQPFYRWIAGALHMLFGDSSMGEFWWDGLCLMAFSLFAYQLVAAVHGFRWGLAAAVLALTIVMQGPTWIFLGIGLSDIASAGFIYFAALVLSSARLRGEVPLAVAMGVGALAAIGFYTRLNNLPMALAVAAFVIPPAMRAGDVWSPRRWWPQISWRGVFGMAAVVALALLFFAWRTWYYTGVFSVLHGTTWGNHALWRSDQPLASLWAMGGSLMMVLTFNDPPRFAWYAIPLLFGAVTALAALAGVKWFRDVPLALALFFVVACSGALAARGVAYAGRFSVHLLGAGCALTICAVASVTKSRGSFRSSGPARD
jgi:hypothetical protein